MRDPQLTERARDDLEEVWCFIAGRRDETTADRIASNILENCRSHSQFPATGRSRDELISGVRSFPVPPYVVFFRPLDDTIQVLRILHGSRDTIRIMRSEHLE